MAGAIAAVPRATWMLQNDHDDDDDAAQGNKSSSVVWLGRTGILSEVQFILMMNAVAAAKCDVEIAIDTITIHRTSQVHQPCSS